MTSRMTRGLPRPVLISGISRYHISTNVNVLGQHSYSNFNILTYKLLLLTNSVDFSHPFFLLSLTEYLTVSVRDTHGKVYVTKTYPPSRPLLSRRYCHMRAHGDMNYADIWSIRRKSGITQSCSPFCGKNYGNVKRQTCRKLWRCVIIMSVRPSVTSVVA